MSLNKMKFIIAILFLAACTQARLLPPHPMVRMVDYQRGMDTRIISGQDAVKGLLPWQAVLTITRPEDAILCGGSLVSNQWILTAAHCTFGATEIQVQLGGVNMFSDMEYIQTSQIFFHHDGYNEITLSNDVALILLPHPVQLTANTQVIQLANRFYPDLTGAVLRASGYGMTNAGSTSNVLKYVDLTAVTNERCRQSYGAMITDSNICAIGNPEHSTCQGDSGGPLVHYNPTPTLVGVVSFVHVSGCASGHPSGYARVTSFLDWINLHIGI